MSVFKCDPDWIQTNDLQLLSITLQIKTEKAVATIQTELPDQCNRLYIFKIY